MRFPGFSNISGALLQTVQLEALQEVGVLLTTENGFNVDKLKQKFKLDIALQFLTRHVCDQL